MLTIIALLLWIAQLSQARVSFMILGDWGAGKHHKLKKTQHEVARRMGIVGEERGLDFVINVGDNFYPDGLVHKDDPMFHDVFSRVYSAPSLQRTWFGSLGNHDYGGDVSAQVGRHDSWRCYSTEFRIDNYNNATLIVLDTNPFISDYYQHPETEQMARELATQNYREQLKWFEHELKRSQNEWKFVVGHHGIFCSKPDHEYVDLQDHIQPLLEKYGVSAYLSGHYHALEHNHKNGVDYFVSGAGSQLPLSKHKVRYSEFPEDVYRFHTKVPGFLYSSIEGGRMETQFISWEGTVMHKAVTLLGQKDEAPSLEDEGFDDLI